MGLSLNLTGDINFGYFKIDMEIAKITTGDIAIS